MIFGGYFLLKLDNPWLLVGSFIVAIAGATLLGWYRIMRMDKTIEWLTMKFSTHYSMQNFNYQEQNNLLLKDIRRILWLMKKYQK